jgi:hypothetical protein
MTIGPAFPKQDQPALRANRPGHPETSYMSYLHRRFAVRLLMLLPFATASSFHGIFLYAQTGMGESNSQSPSAEQQRALSYGGSAAGPLDRCPEGCTRVRSGEWAAGLPGLPGQRASLVAIGTTVACTPHLSADRTTTYTECVLVVERVIKDSTDTLTSPGSRIVITREGGAVSADGHSMAQFVSGQGLPKSQSQYVLFLRYRPATDDYVILTSYLIVGGAVHAVDQPPHFQAFNGKSLADFLKDVQLSLKEESQYSWHHHTGVQDER